MRRLPLLLVLVTLALGCAKPAPKEKAEWTATRPSAEALGAARDECTNRATNETTVTGNAGTITKAAIAFFLECMEQKGWKLDTEPATAK